MNKTLLIIGAGIEACEGIKIAKSLGLSLIIADGNPNAPGLKMADHTLIISTYDGDLMALQAKTLVKSGIAIDGVIAMCADVPLTVAKVAKKLGLPGLSIQTAHWVSDKLLMKEQLQLLGIPIPKFKQVHAAEELVEIAAEFKTPFIIKPVDSRGARGVQLVENLHQYSIAFDLAKKESPSGRVMAEEYLIGPQISTETLIDRGKCYTLGFADRNYEWLEQTKPFMIENGGDSPSYLSNAQQQDITQTVEHAALALGIFSGVAKGDMVLTEQGAKVIEIAGRLSGGYFSTTQIPLSSGVNFIEHAIKLALGEKLDPKVVSPSMKHGVAIRYLQLPPGLVKSITGIEEATKMPGVEMLSVSIKPGEKTPVLDNHTQRIGFVITSGKTKQLAIDRSYDALAIIKVKYVD
jgi:biotin carboxylase